SGDGRNHAALLYEVESCESAEATLRCLPLPHCQPKPLRQLRSRHLEAILDGLGDQLLIRLRRWWWRVAHVIGWNLLLVEYLHAGRILGDLDAEQRRVDALNITCQHVV